MFTRIKAGLTYANVMATVAVFLALGGGAYAALKLPKNSVGSKQIKAGAVNSSKVANRSLLARDFKAGQLPAGPQGPKGDTGAPGQQGQQGQQGLQGATGAQGPGAIRLDYVASGHDVASGASPAPLTTVGVVGEFAIKAQCVEAGTTGITNPTELNLSLVTSSDADVNWAYVGQTDPNDGSHPKSATQPHADGAKLTAGQSARLDVLGDLTNFQGSNGRAEGEIVYRNAGRTVTVTFHAMVFGTQNKCELEGLAAPSS
jgi:hypothetical protein